MNWAGIAVNAINNSLHCHVMNATSTLKHFPAQSNKLRRNQSKLLTDEHVSSFGGYVLRNKYRNR